jgi:hypothetical protein
MTDFSILYAGLTQREIENAQKREMCAHGKARGDCQSSMCAVWTIEELNADNTELQIDPDSIPFPLEEEIVNTIIIEPRPSLNAIRFIIIKMDEDTGGRHVHDIQDQSVSVNPMSRFLTIVDAEDIGRLEIHNPYVGGTKPIYYNDDMQTVRGFHHATMAVNHVAAYVVGVGTDDEGTLCNADHPEYYDALSALNGDRPEDAGSDFDFYGIHCFPDR